MTSLTEIEKVLSNLPRLFETKVTRKQFIAGAATLPFLPTLTPLESAAGTLAGLERVNQAQEIAALQDLIENKALSQLESHPQASLVNTLFIDNGLGYGWWTRELNSWEAKNVIAVARFPGMYRKEKGRIKINTATTKASLSDGSNLWGKGTEFQKYPYKYGDGKRFLVIELPYNEYLNQVAPHDFASYAYNLVAWYHPTHIVLGNELNAPGSIWTAPQYCDYAITTARKIKENLIEYLSSTKILLYGEAYYGNGEFLKDVLSEVKNRQAASLFEGINIHFYDRAGKLPERLDLYHHILEAIFGQNYSFDIYMTEIGKKEDDKHLPDIPHVYTAIQETAIACALADRNRKGWGLPTIEDFFWHTAFMPKEHDPAGHSLTYLENEKAGPEGKKHPKWAFYALMIVCRLLHHNVSLEYPNGDESITLVRGTTSKNQSVEIIWNNQSRAVNYKNYGMLLPSPDSSVEGKPQIWLDGKRIF